MPVGMASEGSKPLDRGCFPRERASLKSLVSIVILHCGHEVGLKERKVRALHPRVISPGKPGGL